MDKIKRYFNNGGKKELMRIIPQFILYVIVGIFILGKFVKGASDERAYLKSRVSKIEIKQSKTDDCLVNILSRLTGIEKNQETIKEILQGKYQKR